MPIHQLKHFNAERWFYLFIAIHLIFWTLVPAVVRYNLPLDAIEGTIWGHQLQWGYDKNPFLNGWLTALATYLSGPSGWMIYLFSQLSVIACFWSVWQLAKKMLTPTYALLSVVILEGIQYYNFHAIDFNDNTLELGLWGLTIYFFYQALQYNKTRHWIFCGIFAALGMMTKYYTVTLLTAMALFLIVYPINRQHLKTLPPYIGLLICCTCILPHAIWLFTHDFVTVVYVFNRGSSIPQWTNHVFFPAEFAWQQWQAFFPALILLAVALIGKRPFIASVKIKLAQFDKAFLWFVGLGPFLLTLLLSIICGTKLRAGWGMPLLSLWGVMTLAYIQPYLTPAKLYRFMSLIFVFTAVCLAGYSKSLIDSPDPSTANFPGKEIAQTITKMWQDTYHTPLTYVAGSRWVGGNIEFYSKDHPSVFVEWNKRHAAWIDENDLRKKGAVFVWSITDKENMPEEIQHRYPKLQSVQVMEFNWQRNTRGLPPIKIGIAVLPPENLA